MFALVAWPGPHASQDDGPFEAAATIPAMDTSTRSPARMFGLALGAAALALATVLALAGPALAAEDASAVVTLAVEERERRPIAPTRRSQLGLVLYGFMALSVVAGGATLRRQLRGQRPQTDGEFRWR